MFWLRAKGSFMPLWNLIALAKHPKGGAVEEPAGFSIVIACVPELRGAAQSIRFWNRIVWLNHERWRRGFPRATRNSSFGASVDRTSSIVAETYSPVIGFGSFDHTLTRIGLRGRPIRKRDSEKPPFLMGLVMSA